jgi:hypothetical protein
MSATLSAIVLSAALLHVGAEPQFSAAFDEGRRNAASDRAGAQPETVNGVFVITRHGPIELIAYAEEAGRGMLKMQSGSLEDVPVAAEVLGFVSAMPTWAPDDVIVGSRRVFEDERAERRSLRKTGLQLNTYAVELRVPELARRDTVKSLLKDVGASAEVPGYAFVVLTTSSGYRRFYPVGLK